MKNDQAQATDWLTVEQARRVAQCGAKLLYREIRAGRLRTARLGGRRDLRIHTTWVNEWLERSAGPLEIVPPRRAKAS
jgi:excisionase family DNA binding protein